ncbi:hypothetical protein [Emticicia sp. W12TSBA100-4]|uniref:hypothetical protein n=1 Tax=Emticicia sp. W12TSBA100-4 TaxID=3160965 RepID=UPI003305BA6E
MKKLIQFLSLVSNIAFTQGSITLTPENTTIEAKTNQPLSFKTNGLERLKISSAGNIGIGQTNPIHKLDILNNGEVGIRVKSSSTFTTIDIDAFNGDAALRFAKSGIIKWNVRNEPLGDDFQIFEFGGGGSRFQIEKGTGNIGIGTTTPTAKLDLNGDVVIRKKTLLPTTTQTVNNLDRNGASVICTGAAASSQTITLTGIAGGVDGMMLWIYPTNNFTIRLENEDAGSITINRIITTTGSANILSVRGGATLIYDGTESRWHVIDAN